MTAGEPSSIQKIQKLHFYSLSATYTSCKDIFKTAKKGRIWYVKFHILTERENALPPLTCLIHVSVYTDFN
jgi:hypothetical protein